MIHITDYKHTHIDKHNTKFLDVAAEMTKLHWQNHDIGSETNTKQHTLSIMDHLD